MCAEQGDPRPEDRLHEVTRPSLPPLLWFGCAQWAGCALAEGVAWRTPSASVSLAIGCGVALLGMLWVLARGNPRTTALPLLLSGLLLGACTGGLFWARVDASSDAMGSGAVAFRARAIADAVAGETGDTLRARVTSGEHAGAAVTLALPSSPEPVLSGESVSVRGAPDLRGGRDEWARRRHRTGDSARVRVWSSRPVASRGPRRVLNGVRRALRAEVERFDGDGAALLQGVLLGERSRVRGTPIEAEFRTTGLSHVLAVSGTHLSIVAFLLGAILTRVGIPRTARSLLVLLFASGYVLLAGSPVSSLRALVMALVAGGAGSAGRRGDALSALSVAIVLILGVCPAEAFDIGFALSVLAVGGLLTFAPLAGRWARALAGRRAGVAAEWMSVAVVAQISTAPVAIPAFSMFSLIAPLANVLVLPFVSAGLGVGVLSSVVLALLPAAGRLGLRAAAAMCGVAVRTSSLLASVPHAAVAVGANAPALGSLFGLCCALIWAFWPQPRRVASIRAVLATALALWCALGTVPAPGPGSARLVVMDVGQGDAILVRDSSHAILIDCGGSESVMRAALARQRIRDLDAVFLTHPHADHTGGIGGLVGVVHVGRVVVPDATATEFAALDGMAVRLTGQKPVHMRQSEELAFGEWVARSLWPDDRAKGLECNDLSLVLRVTHASGFSAVLTGDAEESAQRGFAEGVARAPCEVLKVPHHGSSGGLDDVTLAGWSPKLALVSVGEGNRFGHPHTETLSQLTAAGARVLRTDLAGDIIVGIGGGSFVVSTGVAVVRRTSADSWAGIRLAAHGGAMSRCATIADADGTCPHHRHETELTHTHGRLGPLGPQVRLPDPRYRGPPPRACDRASQEALL